MHAHAHRKKCWPSGKTFFLTFAELKIIAQAIMADATEPCMELALLPEEDDDGKQPLKRPASAVDSDGEGQPVFKKPAGKNNAGKKTAGKKTAGKDNAGNSKKSAGKDNAGKDKKKAGKDNAGQESAGKKTAGKKAAAKAKPKSQPAPKIQAKDKDTFADKARKWKLAQEEEESQDVSDKGSEAGTQVPDSAPKRQLAKARKFKRMSDQQAIPEHIQEAIDKAKSRAEKTEMINELFDIDPKGNIVMKPDKAMFQTMKTASHEKFGKDQTIGMPYEVLLHRIFISWRQRGLDWSDRTRSCPSVGGKWGTLCRVQADKCWHLEDSVRHPFLGRQPHGCHQRDQPGNRQSLL